MKPRSRSAWGQISTIPLDTEKARKWATPYLTHPLTYSLYLAPGKEDACSGVKSIGDVVSRFSCGGSEQGFKPWTALLAWPSRFSRIEWKVRIARPGHVEGTGRTGELRQLFSSFLLLLASFLSNSLEPSALHLKADFLQSFRLVKNGVGLKPTGL